MDILFRKVFRQLTVQTINSKYLISHKLYSNTAEIQHSFVKSYVASFSMSKASFFVEFLIYYKVNV